MNILVNNLNIILFFHFSILSLNYQFLKIDQQTLVLSHLCITGQLASAQKFLNSTQSNSIIPEARKILQQAVNLALINSIDSLNWLSKQQNCVAYFALYSYNISQVIQDNEKISVLKQQIMVDIQELNDEQLCYCFIACAIFSVQQFSSLSMQQLIQIKQQDQIKSNVSLQLLLLSELLSDRTSSKITRLIELLNFKPDKMQFSGILDWYTCYIYKITNGMQTQDTFEYILQREPLMSQILQEEIWCQQILNEYYKGINSFNLLEYLSESNEQNNYQQILNNNPNNLSQLIIQLVTNNFINESKKLIAINTFLQSLIKKTGNPIYNNQVRLIENSIRLIYEITQDPQVLQQLSDFLTENCNLNRNIGLRYLKQIIEINFGLQNQNQQQLKNALLQLQQISQDNTFQQTEQEMSYLAVAATGNFQEATLQLTELKDLNKIEMQDLDTDNQQSESSIQYLKFQVALDLVKLMQQEQIGNQQEEQIQETVKDLFYYLQRELNIKGKQTIGVSSLSLLIPSTSFTNICLLIIAPKLDNLEAQQPKLISLKLQLQQICQINPSSQKIRLAMMYSLLQQSSIQQLINITQIFSKFQYLLGKTELTLAASAAAQQGQESIAMMFLSQAVILDSSVAQSEIYRLIQIKNLQAKKRYDETIQVLSQMAVQDGNIDKKQVNMHILLLRIIKSQEGEELEESYKKVMEYSDLNEYGAEIRMIQAQLMLYLLQIAGIIQQNSDKQQQNGKMLQNVIDNYIYLFYDQQTLLTSLYKLLSDLGDNSQSDQSNQYYASKFGQNPLCCTDYNIGIYCKLRTNKIIDVNPKLKMVANQIVSNYKISLQSVIDKLTGQKDINTEKVRIGSTQEAYLLATIYQTQLNDKYSYFQTFKQLPTSIPQQIMLSEALVAVGQSKQAVFVLRDAQQSLKEKMQKEALGDAGELLMNLLWVLESRSLLYCHRYKLADKFLYDKIQNIDITGDLSSLQLIQYCILLFEFINLQVKIANMQDINSICEEQIEICTEHFNLSTITQTTALEAKPPSIQTVYLFIFINNTLAEVDQQQAGKLNDSVKLFDKYIKSRISPDVTSGIPISIQQKAANSAMNLYREMQIKIAENMIKQTTINWNNLSNYQPNDQDKNIIQSAEQIVDSLDNIDTSIQCLIIKTLKQVYIDMNFEKARTYCLQAKQIDRSNQQSNALLALISHKMNFGDDQEQDEEQKSEKANTPFEDATEVLKNGLSVNRQQALDQFILNGCLVHDMTVVTQCLFRDVVQTNQLDINNIKETYTLAELNQLQNQSIGNYDGYFYLGRGFLSVKMGRIEDGFKDILKAINSQTLCDRYKARALYILATIYLNPGQIPVFGSQSSITGKQKSAIQLQKEAMGLVSQEETEQYTGSVTVQGLSQQLLDHRESDINQALEIQNSLQKLASQEVAESKELLLCLQGYIQLAQLQLLRDKVNYILSTESKQQAKLKVSQLDLAINEAQAAISATSENINMRIQTLSQVAPNYTLLLYINSLIHLALNNPSKARQNLQQTTKLIQNLNQAPSWLSVQAVVQSHLALADLFIQIGKISNSLKELDQLANLDKIQCCSYELYGLCMEKEGSYIDACKYYESAWLLCGGANITPNYQQSWKSGQMDYQQTKKAKLSTYSIAQRLAYNYMKAGQQVEAVSVCQLCCGDDEHDNESKEVQEIINEVEKGVKK